MGPSNIAVDNGGASRLRTTDLRLISMLKKSFKKRQPNKQTKKKYTCISDHMGLIEFVFL